MLEEATDEALRIEPAHAVPVEGWQVNLEQAISALPDESRIVVLMFYMGDCSLKEISEFLGVSVNTVKSKLRRARQQLGGALSEHYGRLLKSQKLRGGFLMHFMEQIRHMPAPTIGFAWSSASIGKAAFALITALCVLIGLIGRAKRFSDRTINNPDRIYIVGYKPNSNRGRTPRVRSLLNALIRYRLPGTDAKATTGCL